MIPINLRKGLCLSDLSHKNKMAIIFNFYEIELPSCEKLVKRMKKEKKL